jgi:hypothetical protein
VKAIHNNELLPEAKPKYKRWFDLKTQRRFFDDLAAKLSILGRRHIQYAYNYHILQVWKDGVQ